MSHDCISMDKQPVDMSVYGHARSKTLPLRVLPNGSLSEIYLVF